MNQHKRVWIAALAVVFSLTAFGVGQSAAGGFGGVGKLLVRGFGGIDFPGGDWRVTHKKGISEYQCKTSGEGCYFDLRFSGLIGNGCPVAQQNAGTVDACSEGFVEEPQQNGFFNTYQFHCQPEATVTTYKDLVWIPEECTGDVED